MQTKLIKGKWTGPRVYRLTIFTAWYDAETKDVIGYEVHYKIPRKGKIKAVRRHLAKRGIKNFQVYVYRQTGKWIPKKKVRIGFERETYAPKGKGIINIIPMKLTNYDKSDRLWKTATELPTRRLYYAVKRRVKKWLKRKS